MQYGDDKTREIAAIVWMTRCAWFRTSIRMLGPTTLTTTRWRQSTADRRRVTFRIYLMKLCAICDGGGGVLAFHRCLRWALPRHRARALDTTSWHKNESIGARLGCFRFLVRGLLADCSVSGTPTAREAPVGPPPFPAAPFHRLGFPCLPCLSLCVGGWGFLCCLQSPIRSRGRLCTGSRWGWVLSIKFPCQSSGAPVGPPPFPAAPLHRLGFPCLPCLSLCVGGGVSCVAYRAQLGRVGGSRLGLGSSNKIPCRPLSFSRPMVSGLRFPTVLG